MAFHVNMPVLGKHMIYNALAATQVGLDMGVPVLQIKEALENVEGVEGRNNVIATPRYTIIDDCYNASPSSMKSSIDILQFVQGRKVAILGDMFELGDSSDKYHFRIGQYVARTDTDVIICIGEESEKMFMGAKLTTDSQVEYFRKLEDAMDIIPDIVKDGDTILVKASNSMNFRKIVDMLLENGGGVKSEQENDLENEDTDL